jgi:hypothetical protein
MTETPFTISVSDDKLNLLRRKLELATLPDELETQTGNTAFLWLTSSDSVERWKNGYDWRKHEKELNDELPMFTRDIDVDGLWVAQYSLRAQQERRNERDSVTLLPWLYVWFSYQCLKTLNGTPRARNFPRGQKVTASIDCFVPRPPQLPCGGAQFAWLWVF